MYHDSRNWLPTTIVADTHRPSTGREAMSSAGVGFSVADQVATVSFDRPDRGNLVSYEMLGAFADHLEAARDGDADVLVVRGEGERFSLGRDQAEDLTGIPRADLIELIMRANDALTRFEGVSVAVVQGKAMGFACGIAIQCDQTVAADTAAFGFDEIAHGFAPKIVLSYLGSILPRKHALDIVMTGRTVPAHEAHRLGLVTRVVPADQLDAYADALTKDLLALDATALRECKSFFDAVQHVSPADRAGFVLEEMT